MSTALKFTLISALFLYGSQGFSSNDERIAKAWKALEGAGQQEAERVFKEAIEADKKDIRAHVGLSLLFELQDRKPEAWGAFRNVLTAESNSFPYISAQWLYTWDETMRSSPSSGIVDMLTSLTEKANEDGMLRAQAAEQLGTHYTNRGNLPVARGWFSKINAITDWMVIGPFDNISASGFDRVFPPETECELAKTYEGKNGVETKWFQPAGIRLDRWMDFTRYFAFQQSVFYANTFVYSPKKQSVYVRVGTSGSLKAFLNDEEIIQMFDENNNDLDTYIVESELQEGWNRLLIKCGYSEINRCNFLARVTDAKGNAIEGLKVSSSAQAYKSKPGARVKRIENFAEVFFKRQIELHPEYLENYVLLAQVYLMNDKATEAELSLREALTRSPNNTLILNKMLEAYLRGEKFDEVAQTLERLLALDPNLPTALLYKIQRAIENEDFDGAEESLTQLKTLQPFSENVFRQEMSLARRKKLSEKVIEVNNNAYARYPNVWEFVYLQASLAQQKQRNTERAKEIVSKYLENNYNTNALSVLAEYALATSLSEWKSYYEKMIELEPAAPGFRYKMAQVYKSLEQYSKAEEEVRNAIAICPNSDAYWTELGEVYRIQKDNLRASTSYENALKFDPANYDAREKLRELKGKKSIFLQFETVNIDSAVKAAPKQIKYPNDNGVVLVDDSKRVVFEKGSSMLQRELLVKIFTKTGIDQYKEFGIPYNPYTESLIVEKAVTIKADGSEVKADIVRNSMVFKQLEENDFVYVKWKSKNHYNGKLSNQFWDENYFSGGYPVIFARYALLVPDQLKFCHRTQYMDDQPTKRSTEDGQLYEWIVTNEPAIVYEVGMPSLTDVVKALYISSIDSWDYLVDWYIDLARAKTRSSFEIKEQVEKLFAGKKVLSEMEKIKMIYEYITENIRYSSVPFRQSPLVPQEARDVLVNKIGDCKDVATLCIAMLREAGIEAHHVLVNTADQGSNASILPTISFNHAIAAVETKSGLLYMDLTANNFPFGSAPGPDVNAFTLLIKKGSDKPQYLTKEKFIPNNVLRTSVVSIDAENGIRVSHRSKRTGSESAGVRFYYRERSEGDREKAYIQSLNKDFPTARLKSLAFDGLDTLSGSVTVVSEFEVPEHVSQSGRFRFLKLPWADKLESDPSLSYDKRMYPVIDYSHEDTLREVIEVKLPKGFVVDELAPGVSLSSPTAEYRVTYKQKGSSLVATREFVRKKSEVLPAEYLVYREFYNDALKEDERQIVLRRK